MTLQSIVFIGVELEQILGTFWDKENNWLVENIVSINFNLSNFRYKGFVITLIFLL